MPGQSWEGEAGEGQDGARRALPLIAEDAAASPAVAVAAGVGPPGAGSEVFSAHGKAARRAGEPPAVSFSFPLVAAPGQQNPPAVLLPTLATGFPLTRILAEPFCPSREPAFAVGKLPLR